MKIGDVVVPRRGAVTEYGFEFVLHCGSGVYSHAIVASVSPFVLVSEGGDMLWSATVKPEYFQPLCQAEHSIVQRAITRFKSGN